jgi:small-conductance mechanosensitive channel/CRP-like cAMP-binding protein
VLSWALIASFPLDIAPEHYRPWIQVVDKLLISYAGIRLALWLILELPATGGWRKPAPQILIQLLMLGTASLATVIVLRELARIDVIGLATTSAVLTAILGLAAQEPLKDLFAGLELQFDDVFKLGDFIQVGDGVDGVVVKINWRDTCLRNISGDLVVVPNAQITEAVVRNHTFFRQMGNRFSVGLDYAFPTSKARALLLQAVRHHPLVLNDPPPAVRVKEYDDSSIEYEIIVFQPPGSAADLLNLRSDLLEQIWYALEREGQSVPYPVRELRPKRVQLDASHPATMSESERRRMLARNPIFAELTDPELDTLASNARCVRFAPGEVVVLEGDKGSSLFQLVTGVVEVLKEKPQEPPFQVANLNPGDVFGEMSMLTDSERSATVQAVSECLLLEVSRADLSPLLQNNTELMEKLARLVSKRRGELDGLTRDRVKVQENFLLKSMQQLFSTLSG